MTNQSDLLPDHKHFYSTGRAPPFNPDDGMPGYTDEPYLDWLDFMLSVEIIPQTIGTSYCDDEHTVLRDYATPVCQPFAQLGARGSSILFSSGDEGRWRQIIFF